MDFVYFLREAAEVPLDKVKYYLHGSKSYLRFCKKNGLSEKDDSSVGEFKVDLESKRETWQVKQAVEAVNLHRHFSLDGKMADGLSATIESDKAWENWSILCEPRCVGGSRSSFQKKKPAGRAANDGYLRA